MPVPAGTKRPMFGHRNKEWTWTKLEKFTKSRKEAFDIGVVLHDICVVDVDNAELVARLEARFPVLCSVPCVATSRGRHYWFRRTALADANGYYDGHGQREHGVDFKSVCHSGTGGLVMVPPSKGKVWLRPPDGPLMDIPFELLDAVATPMHTEVDVRLSFEGKVAVRLDVRSDDTVSVMFGVDESVEYPRCRWLGAMGYFEPFLSGDLCADVWPVPCDRSTFDELIHTLDAKGNVYVPTHDAIRRMMRLADILALSPRLTRVLKMRPRELVDLLTIDPAWWRVDRDEPQNIRLEDVNRQLADSLRYVRPTKDDRWLFRSLPLCGIANGARVLVDDPASAMLTHLPEAVSDALMMHRRCLSLAGGAVTGAVVAKSDVGSDYDLFIHGLSQVEADAVVDAIVRHTLQLDTDTTIHETSNAVTLCLGSREVMQIVLRLHEAREQVVAAFDIPPCKAMAYFDDDGCMRVRATHSWVEAVRKMAFWVDTSCWGIATSSRVLKYVAKGFEVAIPGTQRAAFRHPISGNIPPGDASIRGLFEAEHAVMKRRNRYSWMTTISDNTRLQSAEVAVCTKELGARSDYDILTKVTGRLWYVATSIMNGLRRLIGAAGPTAKIQTDRNWHVCDPTRRCMAMLHPRDPGLGALYDDALLQI
jgi:hypothetical protein